MMLVFLNTKYVNIEAIDAVEPLQGAYGVSSICLRGGQKLIVRMSPSEIYDAIQKEERGDTSESVQ